MASSAANREFTVRAAAIMTTSEVAGTSFDLNSAADALITVDHRFTVGSADSGTFRYYVSMDASTWVPCESLNGDVSYAPTANATKCATFLLPGWKWFRVSVQGAGTMTSSSATVSVRYHRKGTQH